MTDTTTHRYRQAVAVQASQVTGASHSNFHVMLTAANVDASIFDSVTGAQTDGGDIRLTLNADGTGDLPCELAFWDKAASRMTLWTTLSTINNTTNTTFHIWWQSKGAALSQPAVGAALGRNAVWAGEWAVYHFDELSGDFIDSTGNGSDLVPQASVTRADGPIDRVANSINSTNGNAIAASVPSIVEPDRTAFRFSAYWKPNSSGLTAYGPCKPPASGNSHAYALIVGSTGFLRVQVTLNVAGTPTSYITGNGSTSIVNGNYHWTTLLFDSALSVNRLKGYINAGVLQNQTAATNNPIATNAQGIHLKSPTSVTAVGLHEYLILGPVRSVDWTATEYANLNAPASFIVEGTLTDNGSSALSLTLPLLSRAPGLLAPTLTRQAAGSLTLPVLSRAPALLAPTFRLQQRLTFPALTRPPVLLAPTFTRIGAPTITFPLLSRPPTLFAPTLTRQASQAATFPLLARAPTLLSPTLTRQAAGAITLPALARAPTLFGFSLSSVGLPTSLTFPRITRAPRAWPMDLTPQVTIMQLRDPNPFPPNVPESIRRLSPELWDYLQYQAETLRKQANQLQSGADAWPIEYLTLVSSTSAYPLGSKGRFQHPVFGQIRGVYCKFTEMLALAGAPVGFVLGASWVVSNDFSWSSGERAVGVLPGNAPADETYGWVISEGSNLIAMSLSSGVPQVGQELMWSGSGTVSASASGVVIGRQVGSTLASGSVLVGISSANGSSIGAGFAQNIQTLTAELDDAQTEITTIQTSLASGFYAEGTVVQSIETQLGVVVANLNTVTQAFVTGDRALANQITGLRATLTASINAEISRATTAEATLSQSSAVSIDQLRVQFGSVSASTATALSQISVLTSDQYSLSQSVLNLSGQVDDPTTGLSATSEALVVLTTSVGVIDGSLTAISTRTTTLETSVNDGTTGLAATRSRLITEEGTRNTADIANASRSTALEATVNTGVNSNATLRTDLTANATATTAVATRATNLEATVNTGVNANSTLRTDLTTAAGIGTANASAITVLQATVNTGANANATLRTDLTANATATTAVATRATNLEATVNTGANANATLRSNLSTEQTVRAAADTALTTNVTSLVASSGGGSLNIFPDLGFTDLALFWNTFGVVASGVAPARVSVVTNATGHQSLFNKARLAVKADKRYRARVSLGVVSGAPNGLNYLAIQVFDSAGANINGDGTYWAYVAVTSASVAVDYDVEFGFGTAKPWPSNGVTWTIGLLLNFSSTTGFVFARDFVVEDTTGINYTNARITTEETARISADTALANRSTALEATVNTGPNANATIRTDLTTAAGVGTANASAITTLGTTVGGHTATLTSYGTSIGGLQAKVGVRLDVNGRVTGWELNNSGDSDDFIVISSNFKVLDPTLGDIAVFQVIGGYVYGNFRTLAAAIPDLTSTITPIIDAQIAAAPPPTSVITTGVSGTITFSLNHGTSRTFEGVLNATVTGAIGSVTTQLKVQIGAGSLSNFGTPGSGSGSTSDPIAAVTNGTVTNSSGVTQIYNVTCATAITGAASSAATSYLRG